MKKTAEDYGRMAATMDPSAREKFMLNCKERFQSQVTEFKRKKNPLCEILGKQEEQILADLNERSYLSQSVTRESIVRGIFMLIILLVCSPGEFIFTRWIFDPLGFPPWQTTLMALTVMIIYMEVFDRYLTFMRMKYPHLEQHLLLIMAVMALVLVLLIIILGAEIRESLQKAISMAESSISTEQKVEQAESFYRHTSIFFKSFMMVLTAAVAICQGLSYHDLKNRLFTAFSYRRLYGKLDTIQKERASLNTREIELDSQLSTFDADFNHGLMMAAGKTAESAKHDFFGSQLQQEILKNIGFIIASPIALAVIVLVLILMFRSSARADSAILLDLSGSSNAAGYTGNVIEHQKNLKAIEHYIEHNLLPGERIRVIGITDKSFSSPYILLDARVTTKKGYFNEVVSKDKLRIVQLWNKVNVKPTAPQTDIFGAIHLASSFFATSDDPDKRLIFFSDMRQNTNDLDLETSKVIDVGATMKEVTSKRLVPSLSGVKVWCLGVHSSGRTPDFWLQLKSFWEEFFRQSKAIQPIFFTMEREVSK